MVTAGDPGHTAQLGLRAYHRSELQLGGGGPPCVSEGLLGFLIEAVVVKAAHTQMVTEGASSGCKEQYM